MKPLPCSSCWLRDISRSTVLDCRRCENRGVLLGTVECEVVGGVACGPAVTMLPVGGGGVALACRECAEANGYDVDADGRAVERGEVAS